MTRRPAAVLAAAVALLSACAPSPAETALPSGVTVELVQLRSDRSLGRLQLRVENESSHPVELLSATLQAPEFREDAVWTRSPATVPPGGALHLPVGIPEIDCRGRGGPPTVAGELRLGDEVRAFRAEPGDPLGSLAGIVASACAAERTARAVAIEATTVTVEGSGEASIAVVTVALRPTGDGRVRLVEVRPTVLLRAAEGDGGWPLDLAVDAETEPREVTLRMEPARCDAHALADDKVGTQFPIVVQLEDGTEGRFPLPLASGVKDALLGYVAERCGLAG